MRAAIFDLDGTILDSMGMWYSLPVNFLATHGFKLTEEQENILNKLTQPLAAEYIAQQFPLGMSGSEVLNAFDLYVSYNYNSFLKDKPFVKEYLKQLHSRGVKMIVATLTEKEHAKAALARLDLLKYFMDIITVSEVGRDKSFSDIFLRAAEILREPPNRTAVFEDSLYAMQSAKSAGFIVYGVYDPHAKHSVEEYLKVCDRYIHSFEELLEES